MNYKGYTGTYVYDEEERMYHGRVVGIRGVVSFVAPTAEEMEREFQISVDTYLEYCAERGLTPERPVVERKRAS
jgi:predicted HicB family RNase H-like nuclease